MPSKASIYSGGYSSAAAERLSKVALPEKIKCVQCHRHFMHAKFSEKQLNDYRQRVLFEKREPKLPKCRQCVGGPATELTCHRCELTKDLNAYSKVQRRKADIAICKDCQQEVDDVEPNIEDALQEQEILETQTSIGSHSLYSYDSFHGSQPTLLSRAGGLESRAVPPPSTMTSHNLLQFSSKSSVSGASDDGVWTGQHPRGPNNIVLAGNRSRHLESVASPVGTSTEWEELGDGGPGGVSYHSRAGSTFGSIGGLSGKQSGNWAKQGAVKPDRGALREAEKQREAQRKVQEQERARFEEDEDDSSGSEWEL